MPTLRRSQRRLFGLTILSWALFTICSHTVQSLSLNKVQRPVSDSKNRRRKRGDLPTAPRRQQQHSPPQRIRGTTPTTDKRQSAPSSGDSAPSSIGEAIQRAQSLEELLQIASTFWLPTDPDLVVHLKTQRVHHDKRQRWSSQWLTKCAVYSTHKPDPIDLWQDDRLARAVMAAALPFSDDDTNTVATGDELRSVRQALVGLHALSGRVLVMDGTQIHVDVVKGIHLLMERAEAMANDVSLQEAVELRWAVRGLLARLPLFAPDDTHLSDCTALNQRVLSLPFDIIPRGLNWSEILPTANDVTGTLRDAIPFQKDTIVTRTGEHVVERRGTAWVSAPGVGALAYSGKLMSPTSPMPHVVEATMRAVEHCVLTDAAPPFFDCALCNHYPDDDAACKFHTDPEHGIMWERLTCVVAAGDDRRFAFRPIPGLSTWKEWDRRSDIEPHGDVTEPCVIHLFPGDIVKMWGTCNDNFHHAVYKAEKDETTRSEAGRISLVLKRAIDRGGGKRGHGIQGEGRASRRRN